MTRRPRPLLQQRLRSCVDCGHRFSAAGPGCGTVNRCQACRKCLAKGADHRARLREERAARKARAGLQPLRRLSWTDWRDVPLGAL